MGLSLLHNIINSGSLAFQEKLFVEILSDPDYKKHIKKKLNNINKDIKNASIKILKEEFKKLNEDFNRIFNNLKLELEDKKVDNGYAKGKKVDYGLFYLYEDDDIYLDEEDDDIYLDDIYLDEEDDDIYLDE
jgi:hypothetical protein